MAKTQLLLLPGLLNNGALWRHQTDSLDDVAEAQVADLTGSDSIAALAEAVLEAAPPTFALAGLSMGGYVAFEIMRRAPERVERLALFNTSARPDTPEATQRRLDLVSIAQRGGFSKLPPQILPNMVHPDHVADQRIAGMFFSMAEEVGAEGFIRQQTAIMTRPDSRPDLSSIVCPTLVVGGRQDGLTTPEIMAEIAAGIPNAKFVLVDEAAHFTPLEQPQAVSALLRLWLQL